MPDPIVLDTSDFALLIKHALDAASSKTSAPTVPLTRKGYVVMERSWEYNDETNVLQDGGDAQIVLFDYDAALTLAASKNLAWRAEADEDHWDDIDEVELYYVQNVDVEC